MRSTFVAWTTLTTLCAILAFFSRDSGAQDCVNYEHFPRWLAATDGLGDARRIDVTDGIAAVAAEHAGVIVVDVSDPELPVITGSTETLYHAWDLVLVGNHALVSDLTAGLTVVDISDPFNPIVVYNTPTPPATYALDAEDELAVVTCQAGGFRVYDVSNPALPQLRAVVSPPGLTYGVDLDGDVAYTLTGDAMRIWSLADPENPILLGELLVDTAGVVGASGDTVMLTANYDELWVVDVSNPVRPIMQAIVPLDELVFDIAIADELAVVSASPGLRLVDISEPNTPVVVGAAAALADGVIVAGDLAYVAGGFHFATQIIDISNPDAPPMIGSLELQPYVFAVARDEERVYAATGHSGLAVVDMTFPAAMALTGELDVEGFAEDVAFRDSYVYLAANEAGVHVIDVSGPPTLLTSVPADDEARLVEVVGDYLVVGERLGTLSIHDISDPAAPSFVSSVALPIFVTDITIAGDWAYVLAGSSIHSIDLGDPTAPVVADVLGHDEMGNVKKIVVEGSFLYGSGWDNLEVIAIEPGGVLEVVTSIVIPTFTISMSILNDVVYVGAQESGCLVVDVSDPAQPILLGSYTGPGNRCFEIAAYPDLVLLGDEQWLVAVPPQCAGAVFLEDNPEEDEPEDIVPGRGRNIFAYPSPFNPETTISFTLDWSEQATVAVYNPTGHRVATLADRTFAAGPHALTWTGRDSQGRAMPSGTYIVRLETDSGVEARKVALIR